MKRTIAATLAAVLMATTAQAENAVTLHEPKNSYWSVDHFARNVQGDSMCSMRSTMGLNGKPMGYVYVKATSTGHFQVHLTRTTWRFKQDKIVPLTITFDDVDAEKWTAKATAFANDMLAVHFNAEQISRFLEQVRTSDKMVFRFTKGGETDWISHLLGSRKAVDIFWKCASDIGALEGLNTSSQPGEEDDNEKPEPNKSPDKFRGA